MAHDLTNPLAGVIAAAAKTLPTQTGTTDSYRGRLDGAGQATLILADISGSMGQSVGGRRKVDILQEALDYVVPDLPAAAAVMAFASLPYPLAAGQPLPPPEGSTALHLALADAARSRPRHTLVISDGRPDDEPAALAAADRLTGIIDVLYVGPDDDAKALAFMAALARRGRGRVIVRDIRRHGTPQLTEAVRQLALPAPGSGS